ncbi:MAG: efflux RND transporter periplasmic adaptor subunit [bacterium]|nr:efflux RND transporter periplasmic adaptor subunit [bacterium]
MKAKNIISTIFIALILGSVVYGYLRWQSAQKNRSSHTITQQQAPPVVVDVPQQKDVVTYYEFTGETQTVEKVALVARVAGFLEKINFEDGSEVKKGDILFEIEQEAYKAKRDQAYAQLKSSEAELARAQVDFERVEEAAQSNAVSKQDLTTKKAELAQAEAAVKAQKAALAEAELNLSYTQIKSSISGRIDRNMIDVGNLVGAGSNTLLATVVTLSPMYIYFNISETYYYSWKKTHKTNDNPIPFYFDVANETGFSNKGIINYIDNMVDPDTGTITVRGEFPNTDKTILPGMYVRLKIPGETRKNALLVKETALNTDIGGKYLLVVDNTNTVKRAYVEIGQKEDGMRVIESGISADSRYITTGLQFVFPGMKVTPQFVQEHPGT